MIPTRQDLERFEKVCLAATGGDWTAKPSSSGTCGGMLMIPGGTERFFVRLKDAQHIAAANPKACLALLAMLKRVDTIVDQAVAIQKSGKVTQEDFFVILDSLVRYEQDRKPVMILDKNYKGPKPEDSLRIVK